MEGVEKAKVTRLKVSPSIFEHGMLWCHDVPTAVEKMKGWGRNKMSAFLFKSSCLLWVFLQYHNKVTCFMLQQIEEPCTLGAHAAVIIPPTWIIRPRRVQVRETSHIFRPHLCLPQSITLSPLSFFSNPQNSLKSSKKKKRTSFKRKSSKKGAEVSSSAILFLL